MPFKTNACPEKQNLGDNEKEITINQEGVKEGLIKKKKKPTNVGEWLDPA